MAEKRDGIHPKDCSAKIFIKKEDLSQATRDILYPEEKREQEADRVVKKAREVGIGIDSWPGQTRFIPGETGIICKACNFPVLMESFEWDFELKRCDNCGTYSELKGAKNATSI